MKLARPLTVCSLPGPDRKRTPTVYLYRVVYRAPDRHEPGCVMAWEVAGGRLPYQVALERLPAGGLAWHCSCADAVYRGDDPRHLCKHVRGVMDCLPATDGSGTSPAAGRR